jgi:hypothetical protein
VGLSNILKLRYPGPTDPPDGAGAVANLAADLDALLGGQSAPPAIGGTGANVGTSGGSDGSCLKIGKFGIWRGKLTFGSSASWGTTVTKLAGFPIGIDPGRSSGIAFWQKADGSYLVPFLLVGVDAATMQLRTISGNGTGQFSNLGFPSQIGNPDQSSTLTVIGDLLYT